MATYNGLQNITSSASDLWTYSRTVAASIMPRINSISAFLVTAQTAFGLLSPVKRFPLATSASASCPDPQLSCHNTTAVGNLCCFNAPGGSLLQTQFWDANPPSGPEDSFTLHGLWPDNCDGTYEQFCDDARAYTNITDILKAAGETDLLDYMNTYWTSNTGSAETFWEHEFGKHGTCISTLDPECYADYQPTEEAVDYFRTAVAVFKTLPSYDWLKDAGIVPSTSETYAAADIQAALGKNRGGAEVYLGCTDAGELNEIWYFFNVRGSVQTGEFVPDDSLTDSSCPDTGIKYLPKGSSGGGGSSTTTSTAPTSTPTGGPFSGKGYLNVITSGAKKGCIISKGTWYTTGTCAGFATTSSGDGFTLMSSKGACAVADGALTCSADVTDPTEFSAEGSDLAIEGSTTFYADSVPSGSQQGTVYVSGDDGAHGTELSIEWQSL